MSDFHSSYHKHTCSWLGRMHAALFGQEAEDLCRGEQARVSFQEHSFISVSAVPVFTFFVQYIVYFKLSW